MELYPLKELHPDFIRSRSGKHLDEITLENITSGKIDATDIKISREVLILQAEVARAHGRIQLAKNFVRSAELIDVPDDEILKIYNQLRPYRSDETDLKNIAKTLKETYNAPICAEFILETLEVYKLRDLLKK